MAGNSWLWVGSREVNGSADAEFMAQATPGKKNDEMTCESFRGLKARPAGRLSHGKIKIQKSARIGTGAVATAPAAGRAVGSPTTSLYAVVGRETAARALGLLSSYQLDQTK